MSVEDDDGDGDDEDDEDDGDYGDGGDDDDGDDVKQDDLNGLSLNCSFSYLDAIDIATISIINMVSFP